MRILIVTNPVARRTRPHLTRWVANTLSDVAKVRVAPTTHRNHASELAAEAAADGLDAVVALGGDGTVNEVLQGVAGTDTRLAVLPGGSTNVYARTLGLSQRLVTATSILHEALETDRTRRVPAGLAGDRWFAWCVGFGYDAEVVREVESHPRMKRTLGQASFLLHGWGVRQRMHEQTIRIQAGPARPIGRQEDAPISTTTAAAAVICKADPYTYLGPLASRMCPEATLERGLDCTAMTDLSLPTLLNVMRKALTGRHVRDLAAVTGWHDRETFDLSSDRPVAVHTDGDPVGRTTHLSVKLVLDAINLIV
ncbi:diacylglycerol/lipid kinase family protein [Euzebya tangerina]|uniref:diacylglycerol/lipid kinase family protein n=1 Tax=Euzebya tangerina TaxID=591198 RepID=UPI0013C2FF16|nr:diacylglycerol kinase family protein [Euzebya tangerina]